MIPDEYVIRNAYVEDIDNLLPLLAELGYPTSLDMFILRYKKFIQMPGYGVVLCKLNKKVVGFIAWSQSILFVTDTTRFHVEALVVDGHYRKQSIGKKLINHVERIARESSPSMIDLTSSLWREQENGSHTFYEKLGYENKKHSCYFRKYF